MILGLGLNTAFTLNASPSSFFSVPTDLGLEAYGIHEIIWTSWGATVGFDRSSQTYKIWGYSPVVHYHGLTKPQRIVLPSGVHPKTFIGTDNLEGILGEDGYIYLPLEKEDKEGFLWQKRTQDSGGWLDIGMLGSGILIGLHSYDTSTPIYSSSLSTLCSSAPSASTSCQPAHVPTFNHVHPSLSHALLTPCLPTIHPPYAQGSNLYAQLSLSGLTYSHTPVRLEQFDGLGLIKLSSAGVYSSGLTEAGSIYVWGGRYGCLDDALDVPLIQSLLHTQLAESTSIGKSNGASKQELGAATPAEEEEEEIVDHLITPFGGVLLALRNGFVLGYNFDKADLMPASGQEVFRDTRGEYGRSVWSIVWDPKDGLEVKNIRVGSGGSAIFFATR
ncbi:Regulator of chromosome condensation 1/beta-lactamase-inhibitor protein II [Phaffia rhodozyma]|uniref:Regulator of chromosome condensation 1/beta-lactamase-inhibitor protein II n=1 Tax=Phaffia rhodozyma TaxID=264483 RepID=A0A0F7SKY9_PHARH|nr:Regulator of chromosome condensation 1/beta-lactamase-inhibitor protein II [Phaffia rhodozyma]